MTGKTAAEIILNRADSSKPNMGLTNWRGEKIRKQDVTIAKNYLNEQELRALNNLVEQYLIFAEGQAMRRIPMSMTNWIVKLDGFLSLNDRDILPHSGSVSHQMAAQHSEIEYEKYHTARIKENDKIKNDFDRAVIELPSIKQNSKSPAGTIDAGGRFRVGKEKLNKKIESRIKRIPHRGRKK